MGRDKLLLQARFRCDKKPTFLAKQREIEVAASRASTNNGKVVVEYRAMELVPYYEKR